MTPAPRYIWTPADFGDHTIPDSAKTFLMTRGLPLNVGVTTFEFGPYDCDSPDIFVIGQDYEYAVYLAPDGTVWHESGDGKPGDQFMNSSVQRLDKFIEAFLSSSEIPDDAPEEEARASIRSIIARLEKEDPAAFADKERWIWPLVWEDVLAMS
ncbi:MAG TPA: SUKH-4 family immunity protein [Chthoniobacteraceae bacterium]|nr:SUKH-4 family immunity protein [Chthoniobacteraceae bacterium]